MPNYYKILGVPINANNHEIKQAFKQKALLTHPDKNPDGAVYFKEINEARTVLLNPQERQKHNAYLYSLAASQNKSATPQQASRGMWGVPLYSPWASRQPATPPQAASTGTNEWIRGWRQNFTQSPAASKKAEAQRQQAAEAQRQQAAYEAAQRQAAYEKLKKEVAQKQAAWELRQAQEREALKRTAEAALRQETIRKAEAQKAAEAALRQTQEIEAKRRAATPKAAPPTKAPEAQNSSLNAAKSLYDAVYSMGRYKDKSKEFSRNTDKIKELLSKNTNSQINGYTALYTAVEYGLTNIVELLIKSGADVNLPNKTGGSTPLHVAVTNNDQAMVKLLLKNGAKIDHQNKNELTALGLAELYHFEDIKLMLSRPKSTPQQPNTSMTSFGRHR